MAVQAPVGMRSRNQNQRRKRIVQTATALALRGGVEAMQMRAVAERAGVALGTLYRYFPSKMDLVVAVVTEELDLLEAGISRRPPAADTPAGRAVDVLIRATRGAQRRRPARPGDAPGDEVEDRALGEDPLVPGGPEGRDPGQQRQPRGRCRGGGLGDQPLAQHPVDVDARHTPPPPGSEELPDDELGVDRVPQRQQGPGGAQHLGVDVIGRDRGTGPAGSGRIGHAMSLRHGPGPGGGIGRLRRVPEAVQAGPFSGLDRWSGAPADGGSDLTMAWRCSRATRSTRPGVAS